MWDGRVPPPPGGLGAENESREGENISREPTPARFVDSPSPFWGVRGRPLAPGEREEDAVGISGVGGVAVLESAEGIIGGGLGKGGKEELDVVVLVVALDADLVGWRAPPLRVGE